jgi:hypothetical protein
VKNGVPGREAGYAVLGWDILPFPVREGGVTRESLGDPPVSPLSSGAATSGGSSGNVPAGPVRASKSTGVAGLGPRRR